MNELDTTDLKIKVLTAELNGQLGRFEERIGQAIGEMRRDSDRADSRMNGLESKISSMKWWMIGTGLSVVLGIASFNATVLSNMVASFESGRASAEMTEQAAQNVRSASELLGRIQSSLDEQARKQGNQKATPQ